MADKTKDDLLVAHNQSLMAWSRERGYGAPQCNGCDCETEEWWNYCAMCGYHIAADPRRKRKEG